MKREILVSAGLLAGAAYLWYIASGIRSVSGRYETLGPSFFPKLVLGALAVAVAAQFALTVVRWMRRGSGSASETGSRYYASDLVKVVGLTSAYAAALHWLGFVISTLLFQAALLAIVFRQRDWRFAVGIPVALTALFIVIFVGAMDLPLPRGTGVFRQISQLVH